MSGTPQPAFLSAWVSGFGSLVAAHGFAVNLAVVILLAAVGVGLLSRLPRATRLSVIMLLAVCLADWVLIEDLGFFGGLGTDPNSMIPIALLVGGGYLALISVPTAASVPVTDPDAAQPTAGVAAQPAQPGGRARAGGLARPGGLARRW